MATRVTCVLPPLLVFLTLSFAAPAAAQRVVLSVFGPVGAPASAIVDLAGMRVAPFSSELLEDALFLADGSLLLRKVAGETVWRVRDLRSSAEVTLPAAGLAGSGFAGGFVPHPRQPAIFGRYVDSQISLAKIDASGLRVFRPCALRETFGGFELSAAGHVAVILCGLPPPSVQWQIVVVDTATGAELRRVAIGDGLPSTFALNAEGTEVVTLRTYLITGGIRFALERLDTVTGVVLQSVDVPDGGAVVANSRRRALPLLLRGDRLQTLDAGTLAIGPEVRLPGPPERLSFSAQGDRVLVSVLRSAALLVDLHTGAVLQQAPAPAAGVIMAVWGAEPQVPTLAAPVVVGNAVSLSWTLPVESTAVTGYRLEAGSQTGLADILTSALGPAPSFGAAGVPPGRYYVRMRALNGNGMSPPSNEVVVNVP
jgi:hypothetical protein